MPSSCRCWIWNVSNRRRYWRVCATAWRTTERPPRPAPSPAFAVRAMTRCPDKLALVYACSGCSSAAQLANHVAVQLDRQGVAEMSCIAGVGGDVPSLVRTARSGRAIVALDGCALACVKSCLARHGVVADRYYQL